MNEETAMLMTTSEYSVNKRKTKPDIPKQILIKPMVVYSRRLVFLGLINLFRSNIIPSRIAMNPSNRLAAVTIKRSSEGEGLDIEIIHNSAVTVNTAVGIMIDSIFEFVVMNKKLLLVWVAEAE